VDDCGGAAGTRAEELFEELLDDFEDELDDEPFELGTRCADCFD
jgi:hypothetical protein